MKSKSDIVLTLLCLFLLLLPNICTAAMCVDLTYSVAKQAAYVVVTLFLMLLPFLFFRVRTCLVLWGVVSLFWAPVEVACLYLNGRTVSSGFIGLILRTDVNEAAELLLSFWPVSLSCLVLWALYFFMAVRVDRSLKVDFPHKWLCVGCAAGMLAVGGTVFFLWLSSIEETPRNTSQRLEYVAESVVSKFDKMFPYDVYISAVRYISEQRLYGRRDAFEFDIAQRTDTVTENYILLIGESARADHFHLNGYERNTTPCLDTTKNVFSMPNIYASVNYTAASVAMMLTGANTSNSELAYKRKSIPEGFMKAGYHTAWISNQKMTDMSRRMSQNLDYVYESEMHVSQDAVCDSVLVDKLADAGAERKNFYLLHSMGQHFRYDKRHPESYAVFTPDMRTIRSAVPAVADKQLYINSYDNSILYTDYIIHSLIERLRERGGVAALVYISDHGENLFDDERELSVHATYCGSRFEYHVPCIIWLSDAFIAKYPQKVEALKANINKKMTSDVIFSTLFDAASITEVVDDRKSLFSDAFTEPDTLISLTVSGDLVSSEY